jgi:hypothetical protein
MKYVKPEVTVAGYAVKAIQISVVKPHKIADNPAALAGPPAYEADE